MVHGRFEVEGDGGNCLGVLCPTISNRQGIVLMCHFIELVDWDLLPEDIDLFQVNQLIIIH